MDFSPDQLDAIDRATDRLHFPRKQVMNLLAGCNTVEAREILLCALDKIYFVETYVKIFDSIARRWIPFELWDAQKDAIQVFEKNQMSACFKSRQVGATWLALGDVLHDMLFRPIASVLVFSRRDDEAVYLVRDRLKNMYNQLPPFLKTHAIEESNAHTFKLSNGSTVRAFPTSGGDSYTGTLAIVDEADLIDDLSTLLISVKPTVDMGGRLILIGRPDKTRPQTEFKKIVRHAMQPNTTSNYGFIFIPWYAHPNRTEAWYEKTKAEIFDRTGALDELYAMYPATPEEALQPNTLDKRIPIQWLNQCYEPQQPIPNDEHPLGYAMGLAIYELPIKGHEYAIGMDPAQGNPTSDDSSATVIDKETGAQVALLSEKYQVDAFCALVDQLAGFYNNATLIIERNNHGHAAILWFDTQAWRDIAEGSDGKPGWLTTAKNKAVMYSNVVDILKHSETSIRSSKTYMQLASLDGKSMNAPPGEMDDCADSFALAHLWVILDPEASFTGVWE